MNELKAILLEHARTISQSRITQARDVLIPLLAAGFCARRIWLFGSVARMEATEDSDMDIFVEASQKFHAIRFLDRQDIVLDVLKDARRQGFDLACDIIPWSEQEVDEGQDSSFLQTVHQDGVILYEYTEKQRKEPTVV